MDQNQLGTMDPKLREAYERVMGTVVTARSQPPPPAAVTVAAPTPTVPLPPASAPNQSSLEPVQPLAPYQPEPVAPAPIAAPVQPQNTPEPAAPQPYTPQVHVMGNNVPQQQAPMPMFSGPAAGSKMASDANDQMHTYVADEVAGVKQSLKMIQIMYIVGGLVFFVVYALFWMKFFNVASPI
jgi:hypothetical protein